MAVAMPRFLAGFGTGLAVLPLTIAFAVVANAGSTAGGVVFLVLLVGGLTLGPPRLSRVAGYVTGLLATLVACVAWAAYVFSQGTWG